MRSQRKTISQPFTTKLTILATLSAVVWLSDNVQRGNQHKRKMFTIMRLSNIRRQKWRKKTRCRMRRIRHLYSIDLKRKNEFICEAYDETLINNLTFTIKSNVMRCSNLEKLILLIFKQSYSNLYRQEKEMIPFEGKRHNHSAFFYE